jgi:shikimate kinase
VGQYLARHKGWRFTDLDRLIEEHQGRTIAAIFQKSGEAEFRKLETEHLQKLIAQPRARLPHIVALGGGAYAREENARMIRAAGGVVVFLDAPIEELLRRCRAEISGPVRPNLQNEKVFRRLYEERMPHYSRASFRIETLGRPIEEVALEIEQELRKASILWEEP